MPAFLVKFVVSPLLMIGIAVWLFRTPSPRVENDRVLISLGTFGTPEQVQMYEKIIAMFEQAHPHIKVQLRTPSSGGYLAKLQVELAGRVAPDVTWLDVYSFYRFAGAGVFQPLDRFIQADSDVSASDYFPRIIEAFSHQGQLYALPKSCGAAVLFYNREHFDMAGLAYPNAAWTWKDVIEAAGKLSSDSDGDGRYDRFALATFDSMDLLAQHDAAIFDPRTLECTLSQPQAVTALQLNYDLLYRYHAVPTRSQQAGLGVSFGGATGGGRGTASIGVYDLFAAGRVSMIIADLVLSLRFEHAPFEWDIAVQPAALRRTSYLNGAGYALNARSAHPQEAWELIKFLAGPRVQQLRAAAGDSVPSISAIARSATFLDNPRHPRNRQAAIDQLEASTPPPFHPLLLSIMQVEMTHLFDEALDEADAVAVADAVERASPRITRRLRNQP